MPGVTTMGRDARPMISVSSPPPGPEEKRVNYVPGDLRDQLAYAGYDVVQAGLVCGSGGNLSARIPDEDAIWATASGAWLDRLSRSSFVPLRISDGSPAVMGNLPPPRTPPTSEIALHLA